MKDYFEGCYYKHQKGSDTLCLIVGSTNTEKFIQVITREFAMKLPFTNRNHFSRHGVILDIHTPELTLTGKIRYRSLTPIRYDIMGPFRFLPMECSHEIISMHHHLEGVVKLNGIKIDFSGGAGYMERDCGRSFPSAYTWIQANDFSANVSIMAAIATIPLCGVKFRGCICIIQYRGKEYRLATYLGVRVLCCTEKKIVLKQGRYRLEIQVKSIQGQRLSAPDNGKMERTIFESVSCPAEFRFYERGKRVFRLRSECASFEFEEEKKRNFKSENFES